ncbi:MAG: HAD-IA family hydrolase [Ruminococcus sp.]|nr:HAD-IA family hydrolase [Ruminococcus sp.]
MITTIFDLDGTLADTLADLADAVNYGLGKLGCPLHDYEKYKYFVGNGVQKLCHRALPDDRKDETEKLLEYFSDYYGKHFLDKTVIYDGMKECLDILVKNNVTLAVATNKPQNFAREIVKSLLAEYDFIKVLGGCAERPKKPDTAIIREILSSLPDDNEVYMIGDSDVDIKTAKCAEIKSVGCVWGFRGRQELLNAGADFIAETPQDIARFIIT